MPQRSRLRLAGTVATLLCLAGTVRMSAAATSIFMVSDIGDPVGRGHLRQLSAPDVSITASAVNSSVLAVLAGDPIGGGGWYLTFAAPAGTRLVPGAYENAETAYYQALEGRPGLFVWGSGARCDATKGRFEVFSLDIGVSGEVRQFVAEFEQHCDNGAPDEVKVRGLVRFGAGDLACAGAPDGTACDDGDACTPTATCVAGQCTGTGAPACAPGSTQCEVALCDPRTGACLPASTRVWGAVCDAGDACTSNARCVDGTCVSGSFLQCPSDGDFCTDELCDPTLGCISRPAAGVGECLQEGVPSAVLLLRSEQYDPIGRGRQYWLTRADNEIALSDYAADGLVVITTAPRPGEEGPFLALYIYPGFTLLGTPQRLEPELFTGRWALLGLGECGGYDFTFLDGNVTLLEASYSPGGRLLGLSADFTLHCPDALNGFSGSLRWRAGDATCAGAPDGTACDDLNACTPESACIAGACVAPAVISCDPPSPCHQASVCAPDSGECLPPVPLPDGTACVDDTVCNSSGFCVAGECQARRLPACDDDNLCTEDRCEEGQCVHTPGRCWIVDGKVTMQLSVGGHRCACTEPAPAGPVILRPDGSYGMRVHDPQNCISTLEEGRWSRRRKGRLTFTPVGGLTDAIHACVTQPFDITEYTTSGKLLRGGRDLRLRRVWKSTGEAGRWREKVVSRLRSHPTDSLAVPRGLDPLPRTTRCRQMLETCLLQQAAFDGTE